ncbi:HSP90 family protein [Rhodococcus maanshanensis]|uniref:HSP90 family protein n=1 Tax=Rhodococcus maanshanensis TaxID=183556 RepID=UPI0022B570E2|nr:HSP90 family protein [Rhodococcus maanshanensis]MCZ4555776.1 HSP90 family protein [Rhodococcus maanshanensis]
MTTRADGDSRPFQVHLGGIIELLSASIYTGPQVFIRELLQNGCDAIAARRDHEPGHVGTIRVLPADEAGAVFAVEDDGVGLTAAEVGELLATVGRSSKRDILDLPRTDRLGQFGIGLLSCFMVSDEIRVRSRSATGAPAVEWVGRADGTFTVTELADELPVGTRVELFPRPDSAGLVSRVGAHELADRFGRHLPVRVTVAGETVTRPAPFLERTTVPSPELRELGREIVGAEPFATIPLHVPSTGTRGTAFVLPFQLSPGQRQSSRVYLGGMLLSERMDDLLPDWAFFVRSVVDTTGLHPTASRESLIEDSALEETRAELGAAVRRWVIGLAAESPRRLAAFLSVHHLALRALVLHDDELARFIVPHLPIETTEGQTTFGEAARRGTVRYTRTVDEFRQLAGIARPGAPIVNGGYVYDAEIAARLPEFVPDAAVEIVTVADEIDHLDVPPLSERAASRRLQERADAALADLDCATAVRAFQPETVPALYVADEAVLRNLRREQAGESAGGFWADVLGRVEDAAAASGADASGRLALNWRNRLVRTLAAVDDDAVLSRAVRILYVQALLAGHRPLRAADRSALTDAMTDIVHLSVGLDAGVVTDPGPHSPSTIDKDDHAD